MKLGLLVLLCLVLACAGSSSAPPVEHYETTFITPSPIAGGNDKAPTMTGVADDILQGADVTNPGGKKAKGWSASGNLQAGTSTVSISAQKPFEAEAGVYTVQFNVIVPLTNPAGGLIQCRPQAIVSWGVEGGTVVRRFDVANGTSVSGVGQSVKVSLSDVSGNVDGTPYPASIQISPGVRPTTGQPPTLLNAPGGIAPILLAKAGGSASIAVPTDAGVISAMINYGSNGAVTNENVLQIFELNSLGFTNKIYFASPDNPIFVPVSPLTTSLFIQNNDPNIAYDATLTWGIDG